MSNKRKFDKIRDKLIKIDKEIYECSQLTSDEIMDLSDRLHFIQLTLLDKVPK